MYLRANTLAGVALECAPYAAGEVDRSRTAAGHLTPDVVEHARGLVIRDFGVDWRHVKPHVANELGLRNWVQQIVPVIQSNASTTIRILGFSDCVGAERGNRELRRGRAVRVQQLLQRLSGSSWSALRPRIVFVDAAPADDYLDVNSTPAGRAVNRGVLIEVKRTITFEPDDPITPRENIDRIIKRGRELIQKTDQFGIRISPHQQGRIRCLLETLSRPPFDDRFLTAQGVLDFMNMTHMTEPYYGNATQWLLPQFQVRSGKITTDDTIWRTLVRIDEEIIQGRGKINYYFDTHGAATPIRIRRLRDWVAKQQNDNRSIYRCYR